VWNRRSVAGLMPRHLLLNPNSAREYKDWCYEQSERSYSYVYKSVRIGIVLWALSQRGNSLRSVWSTTQKKKYVGLLIIWRRYNSWNTYHRIYYVLGERKRLKKSPGINMNPCNYFLFSQICDVSSRRAGFSHVSPVFTFRIYEIYKYWFHSKKF
jgi:hypothetical protein